MMLLARHSCWNFQICLAAHSAQASVKQSLLSCADTEVIPIQMAVVGSDGGILQYATACHTFENNVL